MTSGEKGKQGFKVDYPTLRDDIKKILNGKAIKTATVKERLIQLDKEKYENIHYDWVKKTLIKLEEKGEIEGGKDEDLGIFLWKMKGE